jgi:hypothetical protein
MSNGSPHGPDDPERPDNPYGQAPPPEGTPYGQAPPPPPGEPYGGYQSMPDVSVGPTEPAPTATPPSSITTAVKLMYVGALISLIGLITSLLSTGDMRAAVEDSLRKQGKKVDPSVVDSLVTGGIIIGVVTALIGIGLWIWMARKNQAGRSWARIVATVLGGLNVLLTLVSLTRSTSTGVGTVVNIIMVLLALAILFLLWRRESSDYYAARSAPRY